MGVPGFFTGANKPSTPVPMNAAKRVAVSATAFLAAAALAGPAHAQLAPPVWLESSPYHAVVQFRSEEPIRDLTQSFDTISPDGWWRLGLSVFQYQAELDGEIWGDGIRLVGELQHLGLPDGQAGGSPLGTILKGSGIVSALYGRGVGGSRIRLGETFTALGPHGTGDEFDIAGFGFEGELDPYVLEADDPRQPEWILNNPRYMVTRQPYLASYTLTITATHYVPETVPAWGAVTVLLLGIGAAARHGRR